MATSSKGGPAGSVGSASVEVAGSSSAGAVVVGPGGIVRDGEGLGSVLAELAIAVVVGALVVNAEAGAGKEEFGVGEVEGGNVVDGVAVVEVVVTGGPVEGVGPVVVVAFDWVVVVVGMVVLAGNGMDVEVVVVVDSTKVVVAQ